jgi:hypothetical protein
MLVVHTGVARNLVWETNYVSVLLLSLPFFSFSLPPLFLPPLPYLHSLLTHPSLAFSPKTFPLPFYRGPECNEAVLSYSSIVSYLDCKSSSIQGSH